MPTPGVLNSTAAPDSSLFSSGGSLLDGTMIDESAIQRDARGLPRYIKATGASLLTPSALDPGAEPKTQNSNSQPGDNIVPWYQWEDAYYNWQIAKERFGLPRDYVPPSIPTASMTKAVVVNTESMVKANAVADRRAAGVTDGDWNSTGTSIPDAVRFGPDASSIEGKDAAATLGANLSTPTNPAPPAMPFVLGNGPTRIEGPGTPSKLSLVGQEWTNSGAVADDAAPNWGKWALFIGIAGVGLLAYRSLKSASNG